MKTAPAQLITFLNSARQALMFDLWTFNLPSGAVVRWTDADSDLTLAGNTYVRGPIITRDRIKWVRGLEVDQCKVKLAGPTVQIDGKPLPMFAASGGFDGMLATLQRVYLDDSRVVQGALVWFTGPVSDVYPSRMGCELVLKSPLTQLNQQLPRNLYQAACLNDLYDTNCAANRAAYTFNGTVTSSTLLIVPSIYVTMASSIPASYLELGALKFLTGANAGLSRTVLGQPITGTAQNLQFARPFPFAIAAGDTISVTAGCNKTMATCSNKFANLLQFRGQPFVPVPETAT